MTEPSIFTTERNEDAYLNSNNGWIEESEPEEDLATLVDTPPTMNISEMNGAYYDGQTIVMTTFPSMFPTGFYIHESTGERHPIPGRDLPTPPSPIMLFSETTPNAPNWSWLNETLQSWRNEGNLPTVIGEGLTSEPLGPPYDGISPQYSIPPIVSRISNQDTRLDLLEDALNEMSGPDAFSHVEYELNQVTDRVGVVVSAFEHNAEILSNVREATIGLRDRLNDASIPSLEIRLRNLERNLDGFHGRLDQIETTAYGTSTFYAHIIRTGQVEDSEDH